MGGEVGVVDDNDENTYAGKDFSLEDPFRGEKIFFCKGEHPLLWK